MFSGCGLKYGSKNVLSIIITLFFHFGQKVKASRRSVPNTEVRRLVDCQILRLKEGIIRHSKRFIRRQVDGLKLEGPRKDMDEVMIRERTEEQIRHSVYGNRNLSEVHLGNYDNSITRPTVASARKSVLWSRERKVYETASRRRLEEFKENPYFKFEYPEIPRHWPGTWAVMTSRDLESSSGRLSRPSTAVRPRTAPLHTWMRETYKTQEDVPRTVKTPMVHAS